MKKFLDLEIGKKICNYDEELYLEVLQLFYDSIPEKLKTLSDLYLREDYQNYVIEVHALKNNTALVGADEVSENAKQLEYAAKAKNYGYVKDNHDTFILILQELRNEIKEALTEWQGE